MVGREHLLLRADNRHSDLTGAWDHFSTLAEAREQERAFKKWKNPARVLAWFNPCHWMHHSSVLRHAAMHRDSFGDALMFQG